MCPWFCSVCKFCHENACPTLWGGKFVMARCGHAPKPSTPAPK